MVHVWFMIEFHECLNYDCMRNDRTGVCVFRTATRFLRWMQYTVGVTCPNLIIPLIRSPPESRASLFPDDPPPMAPTVPAPALKVAPHGNTRLSITMRKSKNDLLSACLDDNEVIRGIRRGRKYERARRLDIYQRQRTHRESRRSWVLDPRTVAFVAWWDGLATLALIFTALVTPFEVAFVQPAEDKWKDGLFLTNRAVDVIFIVDMLLQFRLAYKEDNVHGTRWVVEPGAVMRHYGCSFWFALDLFSVSTSLFDIVDVEGAGDLTVLRAVRTLRLVKLVKLARGSRIFKRWEMRMSINYTVCSRDVCLVRTRGTLCYPRRHTAIHACHA